MFIYIKKTARTRRHGKNRKKQEEAEKSSEKAAFRHASPLHSSAIPAESPSAPGCGPTHTGPDTLRQRAASLSAPPCLSVHTPEPDRKACTPQLPDRLCPPEHMEEKRAISRFSHLSAPLYRPYTFHSQSHQQILSQPFPSGLACTEKTWFSALKSTK